MVSITVEKLSKAFGKTQALDSVSLEIEAGEIFFLLGPSGCGKTTLIRTLAGFYKPDHGRVLFDQVDMTNVPPHKRKTAMMFQSYALWPHLNVAKNVAFGLEQMKLSK
ncbi:MAG: ABC transporter ATP-binding protein, partial [Verrucomicrobiales bacterium]